MTAPIIIQPGSYDEVGSESWVPSGAVWTPSTTPTSAKITIKRTFGPDMVATMAIGGDITGIMPIAAVPVELELPASGSLDVEIPADAEDVSVKLGTPAAGVVTTPVELTASTSTESRSRLPRTRRSWRPTRAGMACSNCRRR